MIDLDEQSNRASAVLGGLLGYDGRPPAELYAAGRRELAAYPSVEYRVGEVTDGARTDTGLTLELRDGDRVPARRVLLATGMRYCPPDVPGLAALWGTAVFQCPFCHGWEMRDKRLAALATGEEAVHAALMLRGWSADVAVLTDGSPLDRQQRRLLENAGVTVEQRRLVEVVGKAGELDELVFAEGPPLRRDGLLVTAPLRQRTPLAEKLGARCASGPLSPEQICVDSLFRTDSADVFAAGDVCTEHPHVAGAIAAGSNAAMIVVQSLLADDVGLPYPPS